MTRAGTRRARQRCQCGATLPQTRPLWYFCEACARRLGVSPYWDGITKPKRSPTRTPAPRRNPDEVTYSPRQALHHVIPHLPRSPLWLIDCGPGSAEEHIDFRRAFPTVQLLGLEPSPVGYARARERWPADGTLLQVAAWDSDGVVTLHKAHDILHGTCYADGQRHVVDDAGGATGDMIEVPARSLDSLDREYGPFADAFLWLDVEGAERRVLRGAAALLERGAVLGVNVETRPETEGELRALLQAAGMRLASTYLRCRTYWDAVWVRGAR